MCIGKLESVDVRKLWAHEQYDFSVWLAKEENLSILGEELGISFTDVKTEQFIGSYRILTIAERIVLVVQSTLVVSQKQQYSGA